MQRSSAHNQQFSIVQFIASPVMCGSPPDLLSQIQALLVDFLWDRLHWVPQSELYLLKNEGQGLIHLNSKGVTFRFRFLQRFLRGPADLVWRLLACTILNRLASVMAARAHAAASLCPIVTTFLCFSSCKSG